MLFSLPQHHLCSALKQNNDLCNNTEDTNLKRQFQKQKKLKQLVAGYLYSCLTSCLKPDLLLPYKPVFVTKHILTIALYSEYFFQAFLRQTPLETGFGIENKLDLIVLWATVCSVFGLPVSPTGLAAQKHYRDFCLSLDVANLCISDHLRFLYILTLNISGTALAHAV